MSILMILLGLVSLVAAAGLLIYSAAAKGRRVKMIKRSAVALVAGLGLTVAGSVLYSAERAEEEAALARAGFSTAAERDEAQKAGAATKAEYQALLVAAAAKIEAEKIAAAAEEQKRQEEARVAEARCKSDLSCWAEKHFIRASTSCYRMVEKMAKWDVEWTDGLLDPKFSHYRWLDIGNGVVTYIGDKAKFQNGFGAWQRVVYECDYNPASEQILDVRIRAGHL